uniref:ATP synthase complex subunit 8 n=1 Tax=Leucoptera malifoliella TaxID=753488 RepID=J7EZT2_9NEOP|nr:ATP synthase F0 subunit 8 [Leucoptera malifoliella]AER38730.1 ATP synthase F0 subunit 8 [Leucoptera malifoliella]WMX20533.1 ATP synthase F0 subunit 8 [Leucoptera malifoliella]
MPQMMPINWIFLFFFSVLLMILFNIMNYYIIINKNNLNNKNLKFNFNHFFWKW